MTIMLPHQYNWWVFGDECSTIHKLNMSSVTKLRECHGTTRRRHHHHNGKRRVVSCLRWHWHCCTLTSSSTTSASNRSQLKCDDYNQLYSIKLRVDETCRAHYELVSSMSATDFLELTYLLVGVFKMRKIISLVCIQAYIFWVWNLTSVWYLK